MANRLFQNIVNQISETIGRTVGVADNLGKVVASSRPEEIGDAVLIDYSALTAGGSPVAFEERTYAMTQGFIPGYTYTAYVDGNDEKASQSVAMAALLLGTIDQHAGERYDRAAFIKSVIQDNILPGDIYLRMRELQFNNEVPRSVLLIRMAEGCEISAYDAVQALFPDTNKDYVISISENDIALVKELSPHVGTPELEKLARSIADAVSTESYIQPTIGIGSIVTTIQDLADSYKEAQVSLEVSKVFDTEKKIISYDFLGIARLIYQLPKRLCGMFLSEVFKRGTIDSLDEETLFTIQKFFENNLNVSETSRRLFVHRNTLVYRLEKIRKMTGLDLREFDDAIVFKVALMVKKYLDAKPTRY
ncbi:MAG: helix-turn-helix domain-containing protein [Oscillospiraceae bacterium]|nr:helix-turn-helix domain-containing protein [Oscillospiraceae bacterium]